MSSIFDEHFYRNLERINASAAPREKRAVQVSSRVSPQESAPNFANMLENMNGPESGKDPLQAARARLISPVIPPVILPGGQELSCLSSPASPSLLSDDPLHCTAGANSPSQIAKLTTPLSAPRLTETDAVPPVSGPPSMPHVLSATSVPRPSLVGPHSSFGKEDVREIVATAGKYHGVDTALSLAVAQAESSFRQHAVSEDGHQTKGVFQLLDSTAQRMMSLTGTEEEYDPFDPGMNAFLGVAYLKKLLDLFGSGGVVDNRLTARAAASEEELEKIAIAAFNAGEGSVARAQARARRAGKNPGQFSHIEPYLPPATRDYVRKVTMLKSRFAANIVA